jgi:DNA-binding transcriptional regulator YhcF (GntR family)
MKSRARPTEPAYLKIASLLRSQVEAGKLRPGDPLPSTREIARQYDVALATAAHALRELGRQGFAEAKPRVGTVVAGTEASPAAQKQRPGELSLERVVAAAIEIADAEGLEALSIRGVAAKLGAPPMSLYRHIQGKENLIERMVASTLEEERLPAVAGGDWRAQLEVASRLEWRVFRRHPWLSRVMNLTRPRPLPVALNLTEWVLRALEKSGLDPSSRLRVHIVLHGFIQGMSVNLEEEARAASETGIDEQEWMRTQEERFTALGEQFPAFGRFLVEVHDGFDFDLEQLFEFGLQRLLDGVAVLIARAARKRG